MDSEEIAKGEPATLTVEELNTLKARARVEIYRLLQQPGVAGDVSWREVRCADGHNPAFVSRISSDGAYHLADDNTGAIELMPLEGLLDIVERLRARSRTSPYEVVEIGAYGPVRSAADRCRSAQDGCNTMALVQAFAADVESMYKWGIVGDKLASHPVVLAWVSKFKSLTRLEINDRETKAISAMLDLADGKDVKYEVIRL